MLDLKLKFTDEQNQKIVDAILIGLKSYFAERKIKKDEMLVSAGYAWTRSNHIDSALGNELKSLEISYEVKKIAAWEYLQFAIADEKVLFLVKCPSFTEKFQKNEKNGKQHYIREYAKSNDNLIKSDDFQEQVVAKQLQLQLDGIPESIGEIEGIDKSYIIVYKIGSVGMIESIKSYLPNSSGKMYEVDDLTNYIEQSQHTFTEEDAAIAEDVFKDAPDDNSHEFEVVGKLKSSIKR